MANGNFGLTFSYQVNPTGGSAGTITETYSESFSTPWSTATIPGTGAYQFDTAFSDDHTLVATSITYTLSALTGIAGGTAKVIAKPKELVIENLEAAGSGHDLIFEQGATNPCLLFTGSGGAITIKPQGVYAVCAPDAAGLGTAVAATSDKIKLDAGGNTVRYKLQLKGTSV